MKLAEALAERKAAQTKVGELNERLQRVVVVQEGEQPPEQPDALLRELEEASLRLQELIISINRTNFNARVPDGRTIMEAIAERDVMRMRMGVIDAMLKSASNPQFRTRGSEIKFVATVEIAQLHRNRDVLAKQYRDLSTAIQATNWTTDLED